MNALNVLRQQKDAFFKQDPRSPIPAAERAAFQGLIYFDPRPELDLTLAAEEFTDKEMIEMQTTTGDLRDFLRWGRLHFEVDGQDAQLTLYYSPDSEYFFLPFKDPTNQNETYSGGRYLDPEQIGDNTFHLDFNLAYAPYCAYNAGYSCPIPPPENWLKVRIEAGEKKKG
jgi:uncharacterized protein